VLAAASQGVTAQCRGRKDEIEAEAVINDMPYNEVYLILQAT